MAVKAGNTILAADLQLIMKYISLKYLGGAHSSTRYTSSDTQFDYAYSDGGVNLRVHINGSIPQTYDVTGDWAAADFIFSVAIVGDYVYALLRDTPMSGALRMYRYDKTNIAAGGTLMTFSGQTAGTTDDHMYFAVAPNGTDWYFTNKANNSTSQHIISKYTLSGTTLTYVTEITCGSTSSYFDSLYAVDASGNIYGMGSDTKIRKHNSSGTIQSTSITYQVAGSLVLGNSTTLTPNYYTVDTASIFTKIDI